MVILIEHGNLIEQRRSGVDVLRILVKSCVHDSRCCFLRSSSEGHREGWLLFRLGQRVMAFIEAKLNRKDSKPCSALKRTLWTSAMN